MKHGPWQAVETQDGSWTLLESRLGQACHAREGAWTEARERYATPTRLRERANSADAPARLRILDVGTGLGWNLAAALEAVEGTGCALEIVSLERDPRVIEACLDLCSQRPVAGPQASAFHQRIARALAACLADPRLAERGGVDLSGSGRLSLWLGDGRETLNRASGQVSGFDAVLLDPFSPGVDPPLWQLGFLEQVAACMAPGSLLSTYTASAKVRARLLAAGLLVGIGPRVGGKAQGTLASPDRPLPELDSRSVGRLMRRALGEFERAHGRGVGQVQDPSGERSGGRA